MANKTIAFYTVFVGGDNNWANLIPHVPSANHDCYFFTNNQNTFNRATWSTWKNIFLHNVPIYNDDVIDAFCSKEVKACPHRFPVLDQYDYTVYFDSKNVVDASKVTTLIQELDQSESCMILPKHISNFHNVWDEYNLCINYPKYASQKYRYKLYLEKYLEQGFKELIEHHYTTQFIIRKKSPQTTEICETWYNHIKECGIECQISFSIIQQLYTGLIRPIEHQACYSYL